MRTSWIVTCALAVIGAFFWLLQVLWLLRVEPAWLPYPVHAVGAALAGVAMANVAPVRSFREPLAAGVLAVVALAAVTFGLPQAFVLTAARIDERWLVLPAVAIVSGLACAAGAWLVGRSEVAPRPVWIAVLAALVAACAIQLGGRLAYAIGVSTEPVTAAIAVAVLALVAAAVTQAVVAVRAVGAIATGVTAFVLLNTIAPHKRIVIDSSLALLLVPIVAAVLGASIVSRARPARS